MIISNIKDFSSMSTIRAKVEIYLSSILVQTCTCSDVLQDFTVSREGDTSKFFGFGVCHNLNVNFIDLYRSMYLTKYHTIKICLGDGETWDCPYPTFYVNEVSRDEDNNTITVSAYDKLYEASTHTLLELGLVAPYTIRDVANKIAEKLGLTLIIPPEIESKFTLSYSDGANFSGDENLRQVLDAIAEVTQTIYYVDYTNKLRFKQLDKDGQALLTIEKSNYYTMHTQTPRTLTGICSVTELGDNIEANVEGDGVTQYIRENPFLTNRTDIADLLDNAISSLGGITINQFDCDWDGDYLLEIGDKISLTQEDNTTINSYLLSDSIEYDGTYNQISEWEYKDNESETPSNPTTIGEKINQTFARVDKVNKEITLVAGEVGEHREQLSQIRIDLDNIDLVVEENLTDVKDQVETNTSNISTLNLTAQSLSASVKLVEESTDNSIEALDNTIDTIIKEVNLLMDEDDVTIAIEKRLENGIDEVTTSTKKYTFNDNGLNISSTDSAISTTITEDGMKVNKSNKEVLSADSSGVKAQDLHAVTYLIIGDTSRLEDRSNRTAVFWIGD